MIADSGALKAAPIPTGTTDCTRAGSLNFHPPIPDAQPHRCSNKKWIAR